MEDQPQTHHIVWPFWKTLVLVAIATASFCALFWAVVLSENTQEVANVAIPATERVNADASSKKLVPVKKNAYPRIIAVGDIMLDRYVETLAQKNGWDYPFRNIAHFLLGVDLVTANLEGPIVSDHVKTASGSMRFSFSKDITSVLYDHNIQLVSIANNHTYDYGADGYNETRAFLEKAGIRWSGHPKKISEDYVHFEKIKDLPIAVAAFHTLDGHFKTQDAANLVKAMRFNSQDFIIVHIHWGNEYELRSNIYQKNIAHALVDAGADVIIGHHPHVTQEIEIYKERPIFYSLGNFVFDQYFSKDTEQGLAVEMQFYDQTITYDLHPIQSVQSQAGLMKGEKRQAFLVSLAKRSSQDFATDIENGTLVLPRYLLEDNLTQ